MITHEGKVLKELLFCIQELHVHENSLDFLSPEYRQILDEADELRAEFKRQPCHLERLYGNYYNIYCTTVKSVLSCHS